MAQQKIVIAKIGFSNVVLIVNGSDSILVDTGCKGYLKRFRILFREHNLAPTDLKLIILSHTHYDHTGNLIELAGLTKARVMVHKNEFLNLKNGFMPIPNGLGIYTSLVSKIGRQVVPRFASPRPFVADTINEGSFDLAMFGLNAKVISTPGHTNGSQSVLFGEKLIAGDTFIHLKNGTIFPHFVNHPKILLETWQKLFNMGIQEIYPGHGARFATKKAFPEFEKWKKRIN